MNPESLKPTIVLVHGAFEDASIWNVVIQRLQRDGYPVVAFANPLLGVAIDAAYLRSVLNRIEGSVIPAAGEAASQLIERFPGSSFPTSVDAVPYSLPDGTSGTYLLYQAGKFHSQVAADVPASEVALMIATQRPMNLAALNEKVTSAAWTSKPSWQIRTLQDLAIPLAEQKFEADRAHSHVIEVNSSHAVTVSNPDVVADVIEEAARAAEK